MRIGSDRHTLSHRRFRLNSLVRVVDLAESLENPFYGSPHRRLPMSLLLRGGLVVTQDEKRHVVTGDVLLEDGRIVTLDEAFTTQHGSPLKNADAFVAKQKDDPLVTPSVGVQGVYVASEETYAKAKEIADRRDVRLHTHLSETRGEVEAHRRKTGLRPVEWLEKIGFLGERVTAAHCTWVTMNEVRALARCGVSVAHCPVSNMKLASGGVAPVPEMLEAGVVVGLGTDSPISNNGMDVFADMKVTALLHKATRWDARIMPAHTVLDLATIHAARALHVEREIGSIEVGKRADLAVVSLKGAHTTPFYPESVIRHLVYSGRGSDVQATIVDGKVLMAGGVVRTVDEADVIARAQETAR